jgi:ABC-2 type transport system permease protein
LRRVFLVAKRDYLATVRTKAFLIGLVVAPLLFGGGLLGVALMKAKPNLADRHVAVVDRTGEADAAIIAEGAAKSAKDLFDKTTGKQTRPRYLFETVAPDNHDPDAQRLKLSDRVRRHELYAFLEIGAQALQPAPASETGTSAGHRIACFSNAGALDDAQRWFDGPINSGIQKLRLARLGVDPSQFDSLLSPVSVERFSLIERDRKSGQIRKARKNSEAESFIAPFSLMMLLGMVVLVGSSPMLSAVTDDKQQRIVEMLLGLASPFELMAGKVLAAVGVSLTSSAFYVVGGTLALTGMGMADMVPLALLPWFYVYLLADVIMLCALAAALGAACNTPQEAQQLAIVLVAPVVVPYMLMMNVIARPNGILATAVSLFPPFAPMLMLLRQALPGGVPAWQPWVALAGVLVFTPLTVWAAARIYRVGILMQGKPPKIADLVRWAIRG